MLMPVVNLVKSQFDLMKFLVDVHFAPGKSDQKQF